MRSTEVATRGQNALDLISVYKALGGGWEIRADQDFIPEETKVEMRERTNWGEMLGPKNPAYPAFLEPGESTYDKANYLEEK
jgi:hypothetical protein